MSIGGGTRNRTRVRFPKRIAIEPARVRVFGLLSFFPRERYQLKGDADWVGERGSSRCVEPEFDSPFRNRTGVRIDLSSLQIEGLKAGQGVGSVVEAIYEASVVQTLYLKKKSKDDLVLGRRRYAVKNASAIPDLELSQDIPANVYTNCLLLLLK